MGTERIIDDEAIFNAALAIEGADERRAYLLAACGDNTALLDRVEALLGIHMSECSFLEQAASSLQLTLDAPAIAEDVGTVIGRYKLLEKVGEGGMAVVYMAEQQRPIRRHVALKIIKLGMDTRQIIARFEAERQALALMDHPNIARVFDGGTSFTGRPYFVMELVRGVFITDYCDENRLSTRQRLELFVQVCNAVQHAHHKGIIHRDIKPTNVMVTLHDGIPVPKVIDFGIAKATNQRLTEQTLFTRYAQMIGTPEYMSPEQAEMSGLDVDTRTDIYSLGVLLYEMLTGSTPFAGATLRSASYTEMQRIIRETDPLKPSTRIRTLGETLTSVARSRQSSPEVLARLVRGDLDHIVMKSLEKDRTQRYETAHALAGDIERHLHHEPILAGSPNTLYRIHKFVRRHRVRLATWSAVAILLGGLLFTGMAYLRFSTQRTRDSHEKSLVLVEDLLSRGEYRTALAEITSLRFSRYVRPKARLLHARVLLEIEGPHAGVMQLHRLLKERDEIAANAHFLLARIYLDGAPDDPTMKDKAEQHLRQGERLLPKTAEAYLLRAMMAQTAQDILGLLNDALDLDPAHYGARRARALACCALGDYRTMETEASILIGSQPANPAGYLLRAIARREIALPGNDADLLNVAIADHDRAATLTTPRDRRRVELCDQRRRTLMRMGRYGDALIDAELCLRIQPDDWTHHFNLFCILTALGRCEEARAKYEELLEQGEMGDARVNCLASRHVFDTLATGQQWHPPDSRPEGEAFAAMYEAEREYRQLASRASRIVAEGFHPTWSPDGTELAYSRGVLGASAIEIRNLATGKTRLLTMPGKDPAWSSDGRYIAYVRDRYVLPITDLATERQGGDRPFSQEEIWIVRPDGTEAPRFLARGGWPNWNRDSNRIYYHSRTGGKLCCISIEPGDQQPRELLDSMDYFPVVSPDERYVTNMCEGTLRIIDLDTKQIVTTWTGPQKPQQLFMHWSADSRYLSIGCYWGGGLWIYDVQQREASKVLDGTFAWCSWSGPDRGRMAMERGFAQWHKEIWVTNPAVDARATTSP